MRISVTGGAGFIGSNFVRHLLGAKSCELRAVSSEHDVLNVDSLTYAGNRASLADFDGHPRYRFVQADMDLARAPSGWVKPQARFARLLPCFFHPLNLNAQ